MKKKYKVSFSFLNLSKETPAEIARLQMYAKTATGIIFTGSYFGNHPTISMLSGLVGFVADTLLACLDVEEVPGR